MEITKDIEIEDLIHEVPNSIDYLRKKGIRCLRCGEPIWGSLEDAAKEKGYPDEKIFQFVLELKQMKYKRENLSE